MPFTALNRSVCYLPDEITPLKAVGLVSLSVVTVVLNSLVIITIWKDPFKELKGTANYLILNLAVCDLLVGFPAELLFALLFWFPGRVIIVFSAYVAIYLDFYASFLTILGLAVERLLVISSPSWSADYQTTTYRTVGFLSIWIFAGLLAFLPVFGADSCHKYRMFITDAVGLPVFGADSCHKYRMFITDAVGLPVLILLFACYTRIFLLVRKEINRDLRTIDQRGELQPLTINGQWRERLKRRERQVACSVFIIVGIFCFCWLPELVLANIIEICRDCIPDKFHLIFHLFILAHPLANPIAYSLHTPKFRRALKKIFNRKAPL